MCVSTVYSVLTRVLWNHRHITQVGLFFTELWKVPSLQCLHTSVYMGKTKMTILYPDANLTSIINNLWYQRTSLIPSRLYFDNIGLNGRKTTQPWSRSTEYIPWKVIIILYIWFDTISLVGTCGWRRDIMQLLHRAVGSLGILRWIHIRHFLVGRGRWASRLLRLQTRGGNTDNLGFWIGCNGKITSCWRKAR